MKKNKRQKLTNKELKYIMDNRMSMPAAQIAKDLDRATNTIRSVFRRLKLDYYKSLSDEARQYIKDNYLYMTHKQMAAHIGVKYYTVGNYCCKNKLYKDTKSSQRDDITQSYYTRPDNIQKGSRDAHIHQVIEKWPL